MDRNSSLVIAPVSMSSFSNQTATPMPFSARTSRRQSTVFRAKREMDFVTTRPTLPTAQSPISRRSSGRVSAWVPLTRSA